MNMKGEIEEIKKLQIALKNQPNCIQNFGPTMMYPYNVGGHKDHIHAAYTNPSLVPLGNNE